MDTYVFLQHYWWFLVSLLGGILVFLLFVQGANSLLLSVGSTPEERKLMVNATGRKWEFTFTTLVTFGGAFFASFPLFYSTSFGGAYWLWMIILFTFVLQAVSYEFQSKAGNLLGQKTYQVFLVINGVAGPLLLGGAVATFFTGSGFFVEKNSLAQTAMPVISRWGSAAHGLEALLNPWNVVLGLAVFFLARVLGLLYMIRQVEHENLLVRCRKSLLAQSLLFVVFFVAFVMYVLVKDGFAVGDDGVIFMEPYKYLHNFLAMPAVLILFLLGVVAVLWGIGGTLFCKNCRSGIWFAGVGTVVTVLALLLCAGYNHTAYYPSTADLQSSLTLENSCSGLFTMKVMSWASLLIPFVLAYIVYAWRAIDRKRLTTEELAHEEEAY